MKEMHLRNTDSRTEVAETLSTQVKGGCKTYYYEYVIVWSKRLLC